MLLIRRKVKRISDNRNNSDLLVARGTATPGIMNPDIASLIRASLADRTQPNKRSNRTASSPNICYNSKIDDLKS